MYLLDTNVVSEIRKGRAGEHGVISWVQSLPTSSFYLSVISILELEIGVLLKARRDRRQAEVLRTWIERHILPSFAGRILSVDIAVAQRCAALHVPNPRSDRDALIAATAFEHGLTVVTRNTSDFEPMGVDLINPWQL
jgi:predicted nucleic acid-binding protein